MQSSNDCLSKCRWFPFSDDPILSASFAFSHFANPQILFPEQSCDSRWHMFCHSYMGIHHFVSTSGIAWESQKLIQKRGGYPSVYNENEYYYLIYETHYTGYMFFPSRRVRRSPSRIEMRISTDLLTWSKPRVIFEGKSVKYASDYLESARIQNPQIIKINGGYRLYFGSSRLYLPDVKRSVSRYFSYAQSDSLQGVYSIPENSSMLIQSSADDKYTNLACGGVNVVMAPDSMYAFQCPVFWDEEKRKPGSCILLLKSNDGLKWSRVSEKPVLETPQCGWASAYITGCDVHYREQEHSWYCYYSAGSLARNDLFSYGVGLMLGCVPPLK